MRDHPDYYEAPDYYDRDAHGGRPVVFLAGGITHCPDWQQEAARILLADRLVVLNPRRKHFDLGDANAWQEQVAWEHYHLHLPNVVTMFWFPACDPALTVQPIALFELGQALGEGRQIAVGADPGYPRRRDVEMLMAHNSPLRVQETLTSTLNVTLERAWWFKGTA